MFQEHNESEKPTKPIQEAGTEQVLVVIRLFKQNKVYSCCYLLIKAKQSQINRGQFTKMKVSLKIEDSFCKHSWKINIKRDRGKNNEKIFVEENSS